MADAEDFGFLVGFLSEAAGHDVTADLAVPREVHRNHRELRGRASLQKEDVVIVSEAHQREDVRLRLIEHRFELFGAVADLNDGFARSFEVQKFALRFLQHFQGLSGGAGIEIVNAICFHKKFLPFIRLYTFYCPLVKRSTFFSFQRAKTMRFA